MSRKSRYFLAIIILLTSCKQNLGTHNAAVLEHDSPAVGNSGLLVENVGIETLGGAFTPLLKTGCAMPCKDSEIFSTAQDNQSKFQVSLFRGTERLVSKNHRLGVCYVVGIPAAPRGVPKIEVTVEAAEREIRIYALDQLSKKALAIQCGGNAGG